jgi:apolipoprotein N-acyltransferase
LVGALDFMPDKKPWREYRFYNSTFLFHPEAGRRAEQYSKLRLVPFSEKLPFENIFPLLNYVNLGEGDFSPGDGYRIWGDAMRYAPSICYEIIYPDFVRKAREAGAQFLVNVTNDGWFGRSNGPHQHANIARFRAMETGLPIARCSNTGISVFYDAWGRDLGHTALLDSTVLRRKLPVPERETLYARYGGLWDGFYWLALGVWIAATIALHRLRKPSDSRY